MLYYCISDFSTPRSLLAGIGMVVSKVVAQDMINEVDADGSGLIEFDEFLKLMMMYPPPF